MFSVVIRHMSSSGGILASRVMGASGGTIKPVRKHYEMEMSYRVNEGNGNAATTVDVLFPSGTYAALDYTPVWAHHRFCGWYASSLTPSSAVPSGTPISPDDKVVYARTDVYAGWQTTATVTFDATTNGGTMPSGWAAPDYYEGQPYGTLPAPTKSGEVFLGWFSGSTRVTAESTIPSGGASLVARYAAVTYDTSFEVTTTSSSKKAGIYAANSRNSSNPTVVDWGDGTTAVVYGNISQLTHEYSSAATFTVRVNDNISSFALSINNSTWYQTTTNNRYVVKKILSLSSNITSLPNYAFYYCGAMTDAVLPSSVSSVPTYCFYYCQSLKGITIPSNYTSIGTYAFGYCTNPSFSSVTIPAAVTSIGNHAFRYCYYLKDITFEASSSALTLGTYAFAYCFYYSSATGTIDLSPRKITTISNYCFYYCYYLKGITWPQGLTTIGTSAFRYCFYYATSTAAIFVPEGVTTFSGNYAFSNCAYLTAITLPSTLTNISNYTFYSNTRLATITCNRTSAPTAGASSFGDAASSYTGRNSYSAGTNRLYVPTGATGYNASYWASVLLDSTKCGFTKVEIPNSYVILEWIQSAGTNTQDGSLCSYINTGVEASDGMTAHIEWQWVSQATDSTSFAIIFGGGKRISNAWRTWAVGRQDNGASAYNTTAGAGGSFSTSTQNGWYISEGTCANYAYTSNPENPWFFFAQNESWESGLYSFKLTHFAIMRLRYATLSSGGSVIHEYLPAIRVSDSAVGLLDTVTQDFLTSPSGVAFEAGPQLRGV